MWSSNPIFFPFPQHFRFRSLKCSEDDIIEDLDISFHTRCRSSHLEDDVDIFLMEFLFYEFNSIEFILFSLCTTCLSLYVWILTFEVGVCPYYDNWLDGIRWHNNWDFIQSYINMWNKIRSVFNLLIQTSQRILDIDIIMFL